MTHREHSFKTWEIPMLLAFFAILVVIAGFFIANYYPTREGSARGQATETIETTLNVSSVALASGWRIAQFFPSPQDPCAAPNYHAVFAPEQSPRLHAFHVPECAIEYQYSEQGLGSDEEQKPNPTYYQPALHRSAGFFFYNSFTASATIEGVPFRPDMRPFMEMHFSGSKSAAWVA